MASVIIYPPGAGTSRVVPLDRRVTSFGSDPGNDVVLDGGDAQPHHAHILYEKGAYSAATTDNDASLTVNGKRKKSLNLIWSSDDRSDLNARLDSTKNVRARRCVITMRSLRKPWAVW